MSNRLLVTGGAGYIGSHVVQALQAAGFEHIVVLDNLCNGFANSLPYTVKLIVGDVQNEILVNDILHQEQIDTVLHFAAITVISESIKQPLKYYQNNTQGTLTLLKACVQHNVKHFIFSSTAAIYGPSLTPITENTPCAPTNPYGRSKWMSEQLVQDTCAAHGMKAVILRYFNVAGASPCGKLGQRTVNATHLIKRAVQTALDPTQPIPVYGTDYPTQDGTCIRDYIHVSDLATAHVKALEYLNKGGESIALNCGYGRGYSVKEVLETLETVAKIKLLITLSARREGDLPIVVADNTQIKSILDWQPKFDDLSIMIQTAYEFEKNH